MSRTTWILFLLAGLCYLAASTEIAAVLTVFAVLFELSMYVSMFADAKRKKDD